MCEHCGCRGVRPIAELMDEHYVLLDLAGDIRRSLAAGDHPAAEAALRRLARLLARHVGREERGVLAAVKQQGDFAEAAEKLEDEHTFLDRELDRLDVADPAFPERALSLLDALAEHIDRENLGVFPVAVVTLGAAGWETVGQAHAEQPSFLTDEAAAPGPS